MGKTKTKMNKIVFTATAAILANISPGVNINQANDSVESETYSYTAKTNTNEASCVKTTAYTNMPKVSVETVEDAECCSRFPEACAITWEYTGGRCFKKVDGSSSTDAPVDQCCLEGWAIGSDTLKAACNISTVERKFDADKKECTIVSTKIYPILNDTEVF